LVIEAAKKAKTGFASQKIPAFNCVDSIKEAWIIATSNYIKNATSNKKWNYFF
jgi:hypothetical protein